MEPFKSLTGIAAALPRANLDTDQIMPKQFLRGIDKAGLADGLLYNLRFDAVGQRRPDFVLNRPEAEGALREARDDAEALGHRRVLWQILRELGRVRAAEGDAEEASRLDDEAGRIVLEIASTIGDESLRASFLTRPDVVSVLPER